MRTTIRIAALLALASVWSTGPASAQPQSNEPPFADAATATTSSHTDTATLPAGALATGVGSNPDGNGGNNGRPRLTPCMGPGCGGGPFASLTIGPGALNAYNWTFANFKLALEK